MGAKFPELGREIKQEAGKTDFVHRQREKGPSASRVDNFMRETFRL